MRRCICVVAALGFLIAFGGTPTIAQIHFSTILNGAQEVPFNPDTLPSGTGAFTLNEQMDELAYRISYQGLSGPLTAGGHFHVGRPGVAGGIVHVITTSGDSAATFAGVWRATDSPNPLTPALVESLLTGKIYVNFHTNAHPLGEIRGQVNLASGLHFQASLSGGQEVPAQTTTGTGTGVFWLNAERNRLTYQITYRSLSGPLSIGGHFHSGAPGTNGAIQKNIASAGDSASNTLFGQWTHSDSSQPLTPALVDSLIAGKIYVNFHTTAHPGGEIRGQLQMGAGLGFRARLNGANEFPPNTATGTGTGSMILTQDRTQLLYEFTYIGLTGPLTSARFQFSGDAGLAKTIVTSDSASRTISGIWGRTDPTNPLTPAIVESLLAGKIYVNFYTAANPGGEIRSQVDPTVAMGAIVAINGAQETPPVSTPATGTASVVLSAERTLVHYTITYVKLSGPLTLAHFHVAPPGVPGPIRKDISGADSSSATLSGTWGILDGTQPLTGALVDSFIANKMYLNFHTSAHGSGEIRGQIMFDSVAAVTSVGDSPHAIPVSFALRQNYPNPFNPQTMIEYDLPQASYVTLKVYNVLGVEVGSLVNERQGAGIHRVSFEGQNLSSGVYFYTLVTNQGTSLTRKMLLMK